MGFFFFCSSQLCPEAVERNSQRSLSSLLDIRLKLKAGERVDGRKWPGAEAQPQNSGRLKSPGPLPSPRGCRKLHAAVARIEAQERVGQSYAIELAGAPPHRSASGRYPLTRKCPDIIGCLYGIFSQLGVWRTEVNRPVTWSGNIMVVVSRLATRRWMGDDQFRQAGSPSYLAYNIFLRLEARYVRDDILALVVTLLTRTTVYITTPFKISSEDEPV